MQKTAGALLGGIALVLTGGHVPATGRTYSPAVSVSTFSVAAARALAFRPGEPPAVVCVGLRQYDSEDFVTSFLDPDSVTIASLREFVPAQVVPASACEILERTAELGGDTPRIREIATGHIAVLAWVELRSGDRLAADFIDLGYYYAGRIQTTWRCRLDPALARGIVGGCRVVELG